MPQVISGEILGSPGAYGSRPIYILYGAVDPNSSTDTNLAGGQTGSLYINYVAATLWIKSSLAADPSTPNGVWTQIS